MQPFLSSLSILILVLTSCSSDYSTSEEFQSEKPLASSHITKNSQPEIKQIDSIPEEAKTCSFSTPDTSVFGINLIDKISAEEKLGTNISLKRESGDLPYVRFSSRDKKESLTLFFHPGSTVHEFAEILVSSEDSKPSTSLETSNFITNNGIRLGITKTEVITILGKCFEWQKDTSAMESLIYRITDMENSSFLKRSNYPSYYAIYCFKNNRLVRFRFGFEYP